MKIAVIGGGLAGIFSANEIADTNSVVLFDENFASSRLLGGFAAFSGAKFSLPPAGMGLLVPSGGTERFRDVLRKAVRLLELDISPNEILITSMPANESTMTLREYRSVVLNTERIDYLLRKLEKETMSKGVLIARSQVTRISGEQGAFTINFAEREESGFDRIIYAAGRACAGLLTNLNAVPNSTRSFDVGFRVQFDSKLAVSGLRQIGPDAKILFRKCRTFCLNSPGEIYQYPFQNLYLPGGVVASESTNTANFAILRRIDDRTALAPTIQSTKVFLGDRTHTIIRSATCPGRNAEVANALEAMYGISSAEEFIEFSNRLMQDGHVNWFEPHSIYLPLFDWHWDTFAVGATHRTSVPGIYVAGDVSGHARGLLQAAVSGILAGREVLLV